MDFNKVTWLSPSLSNNHSGFLCHVTFCIYPKYNIGATYSQLQEVNTVEEKDTDIYFNHYSLEFYFKIT